MTKGPEGIGEQVIFTKELQMLKLAVERGVMDAFLGEGTHNQELAGKWVDDYSEKYRNIFKRRMFHESNFLDRCKNAQFEIVGEVFAEMTAK